MASDYFDFKKFRVWHHQSAMKVGTDAVLLGCLIEGNFPQETRILDIGTGTGVIALILAQRFSKAQIYALEIDAAAAAQAQYNFEHSIFSERLVCIQNSFQKWSISQFNKYELIVSNPPFYLEKANYSIENNARKMARHDAALPFEELADGVLKHLDALGKFWLILPVPESKKFLEIASKKGLYLSYEISIVPLPGKDANRVVQCYSLNQTKLVQTEICLRNEAGNKSEEYQKLSSEFYL